MRFLFKWAVVIAVSSLLTGCSALLAKGEPRKATAVVWGQSNAVIPETWLELQRIFKDHGIELTIINVAVSNTSIKNWADDWNGMLSKLVSACQAYQPDFVLGVQGEGDGKTPKEAYFERIRSVIEAVKAVAPHTKPVQAFCSFHVSGLGDPRGGQRMLIDSGLAFEGPDLDPLRKSEGMTFDTLHLSDKGCRAFAGMWWEKLNTHLPK